MCSCQHQPRTACPADGHPGRWPELAQVRVTGTPQPALAGPGADPGARKLAGLITRILIDYAALGAKRMDLRRAPLHVPSLLAQVQAAVAEAAQVKGLDVRRTWLRRVLQTGFLRRRHRCSSKVIMQLADNAIRIHDRAGDGQVDAPVRWTAAVCICSSRCKDTGVGITPEPGGSSSRPQQTGGRYRDPQA